MIPTCFFKESDSSTSQRVKVAEKDHRDGLFDANTSATGNNNNNFVTDDIDEGYFNGVQGTTAATTAAQSKSYAHGAGKLRYPAGSVNLPCGVVVCHWAPTAGHQQQDGSENQAPVIHLLVRENNAPPVTPDHFCRQLSLHFPGTTLIGGGVTVYGTSSTNAQLNVVCISRVATPPQSSSSSSSTAQRSSSSVVAYVARVSVTRDTSGEFSIMYSNAESISVPVSLHDVECLCVFPRPLGQCLTNFFISDGEVVKLVSVQKNGEMEEAAWDYDGSTSNQQGGGENSHTKSWSFSLFGSNANRNEEDDEQQTNAGRDGSDEADGKTIKDVVVSDAGHVFVAKCNGQIMFYAPMDADGTTSLCETFDIFDEGRRQRVCKLAVSHCCLGVLIEEEIYNHQQQCLHVFSFSDTTLGFVGNTVAPFPDSELRSYHTDNDEVVALWSPKTLCDVPRKMPLSLSSLFVPPYEVHEMCVIRPQTSCSSSPLQMCVGDNFCVRAAFPIDAVLRCEGQTLIMGREGFSGAISAHVARHPTSTFEALVAVTGLTAQAESRSATESGSAGGAAEDLLSLDLAIVDNRVLDETDLLSGGGGGSRLNDSADAPDPAAHCEAYRAAIELLNGVGPVGLEILQQLIQQVISTTFEKATNLSAFAQLCSLVHFSLIPRRKVTAADMQLAMDLVLSPCGNYDAQAERDLFNCSRRYVASKVQHEIVARLTYFTLCYFAWTQSGFECVNSSLQMSVRACFARLTTALRVTQAMEAAVTDVQLPPEFQQDQFGGVAATTTTNAHGVDDRSWGCINTLLMSGRHETKLLDGVIEVGHVLMQVGRRFAGAASRGIKMWVRGYKTQFPIVMHFEMLSMLIFHSAAMGKHTNIFSRMLFSASSHLASIEPLDRRLAILGSLTRDTFTTFVSTPDNVELAPVWYRVHMLRRAIDGEGTQVASLVDISAIKDYAVSDVETLLVEATRSAEKRREEENTGDNNDGDDDEGMTLADYMSGGGSAAPAGGATDRGFVTPEQEFLSSLLSDILCCLVRTALEDMDARETVRLIQRVVDIQDCTNLHNDKKSVLSSEPLKQFVQQLVQSHLQVGKGMILAGLPIYHPLLALHMSHAMLENVLKPNVASSERAKKEAKQVEYTCTLYAFLCHMNCYGAAAWVAHYTASKLRCSPKLTQSTLTHALRLIGMAITAVEMIADIRVAPDTGADGDEDDEAGGGMFGFQSTTDDYTASGMYSGGTYYMVSRSFYPTGSQVEPGAQKSTGRKMAGLDALTREDLGMLRRHFHLLHCEAKLFERGRAFPCRSWDDPIWTEKPAAALEELLRELEKMRCWTEAVELAILWDLDVQNVLTQQVNDALDINTERNWGVAIAMLEKYSSRANNFCFLRAALRQCLNSSSRHKLTPSQLKHSLRQRDVNALVTCLLAVESRSASQEALQLGIDYLQARRSSSDVCWEDGFGIPSGSVLTPANLDRLAVIAKKVVANRKKMAEKGEHVELSYLNEMAEQYLALVVDY